jgi:hypothetical protein
MLMKKTSLFALTILVATYSAGAPSIPELRMTPMEITSGDKGDSQIGSSKLAGGFGSCEIARAALTSAHRMRSP